MALFLYLRLYLDIAYGVITSCNNGLEPGTLIRYLTQTHLDSSLL